MHVTPVHEATDLSVAAVAFITHFMFSACFSVIYSTCNTFSKKQSLFFFQWSSELASPSQQVIPDHICLVLRGQRTREAERNLWATSTCRRDASKAWAHLGGQEIQGFSGHREIPSLQGWGCAVSVLPSPRMMPAPSHTKFHLVVFHNPEVSQCIPQHCPKLRMHHYQMQVAMKSIKQK